jgi:HK97 family phage portal protein
MSQTVVIRQRPAPSWFARVGQSVRSFWNPALPLRDPALAKYFQQGEPSYTGIPVTEQNAFTFSAVFDAVNQISSDVAKLPLNLLKRNKGGGKRALHGLKTLQPAEVRTEPRDGLDGLPAHLDRARADVQRWVCGDRARWLGRPVALWPITPDRVQPFRNTGPDGRPAGPLRYRIDGKTTLEGDDVLHIHGLGYDGYVGYSVINKARQAIGLALAAERFGAEFFTSGASIGGILTSDQNYPDEDQEKQIRASMGEYQKKAGALRQFLLLFGGEWKFDPTGVKPSESQMNELRSRQVEEVARFFNMPVHKLKSLDRATFSNIEQQDLEYYKGCLLTWITLWEEELNRKLIPSLERTQQYVKHNANAFLRGDIQSRYGAYAIALDKGLFSRNEIRDLEDMNPQTGGQGDLYLVQQAQVPLNLIADLTQSQIDKNSTPPPAPPAPPSSGAGDGEAVKAANARADAADVLARESREALARAEERLALAEATGAEKDADLDSSARAGVRAGDGRGAVRPDGGRAPAHGRDLDRRPGGRTAGERSPPTDAHGDRTALRGFGHQGDRGRGARHRGGIAGGDRRTRGATGGRARHVRIGAVGRSQGGRGVGTRSGRADGRAEGGGRGARRRHAVGGRSGAPGGGRGEGGRGCGGAGRAGGPCRGRS